MEMVQKERSICPALRKLFCFNMAAFWLVAIRDIACISKRHREIEARGDRKQYVPGNGQICNAQAERQESPQTEHMKILHKAGPGSQRLP